MPQGGWGLAPILFEFDLARVVKKIGHHPFALGYVRRESAGEEIVKLDGALDLLIKTSCHASLIFRREPDPQMLLLHPTVELCSLRPWCFVADEAGVRTEWVALRRSEEGM